MKRPIRIGLIAEGEAELGQSVPYIVPETGGKAINRAEEGALHTLIRRELKTIGYECEFIQRHPTIKETYKGKFKTGHGILSKKYVSQIVVTWKPEEVDMIIILVDADEARKDRTRNLKKALKAIQQNHFDHNDQPIPDRHAGGLAIKNFDTWLLADTEQVEKLLNQKLSPLPHNLESLSGDRESDENAKNILNNIIDQSQYSTQEKEGKRQLKVRWELAFIADLTQIKRRCSQGYKPFITAVTAVCTAAGLILKT